MLRCLSVYRHAVVNTPVARWALIARGTAYSNRFPVPSGGGLPHHCARSATTLDFSRPAQRSLAVTACRLAEPPIATRLSRRLRRFRFLHRRSDSYRLERPSCRVGVTPTEDQHLTRFTAHAVHVLLLHISFPRSLAPGAQTSSPSVASASIQAGGQITQNAFRPVISRAHCMSLRPVLAPSKESAVTAMPVLSTSGQNWSNERLTGRTRFAFEGENRTR